jgi:exonuclease III
VSTKCKKSSLKVSALCKTGADIILLSDIRLNSAVQTAAVNNITKQFNFNGYDFYHNSNFSSRGVGILIKKQLALTIVETRQDRLGNILLLKLTGTGIEDLVLTALYGPNENNGDFFADLTRFLTDMQGCKIICRGDLNCTWDSSPADINIDTLFMRSIPRAYRTNKIRNLAEIFD